MKRFKIGFLAIIALAAMSFTVADNVRLFKSKNVKTVGPEDCFTPSGSALKVRGSNCTTETTITSSTNCSNISVGDHVWGISTSAFFESGYTETEVCPGSGKFCCLNLVSDDNVCTDPDPSQPVLFSTDEYEVASIECRQ
jgi:hypothetical protein